MVATATAVAAATVEVTRGERIRMTLPVTTLGVMGLAGLGFCTTCDGTTFCTGLCAVDWTRNGVATVGVTVDLAAAAGGVVEGRTATVVTGGDVTGTVVGVATITGAVIAAAVGVVLTMGAVGVGALTGGKAPVAAGGMSYFCI